MALPPGRRPECRSYLFRCESAPFEEARLASPFPVVGGHRFAESLRPHPRRVFEPEFVFPVDGILRRLVVDAAPAKLVPNAPGATAAAEARVDVLFGEALLAEEPLRLQRFQDSFNRANLAAACGELDGEFATGVLAAGEQLQGSRPKLRIVLTGQASTASPASLAERLLPGSSMSRRAVSIEWAIGTFSLRKSRTLSRPWPIRWPS